MIQAKVVKMMAKQGRMVQEKQAWTGMEHGQGEIHDSSELSHSRAQIDVWESLV